MSQLLLTLGHNSSAILVSNQEIVCGYEEERLSLIKSDSHFPKQAIAKCVEMANDPIDEVYVSHWFPYGELPANPNKYWNPYELIKQVGSNATVMSVNQEFTHHDAHAWSAVAFCADSMPRNNTGIIVADGFGNFGECLSIYELTRHGEPKLKRRAFGYSDSLGLMYQYATAYLGLKENQDEYKLLGYETRVHSMFHKLVPKLLDLATKHGEEHANRLLNGHWIGNPFDPMYAVDALPAVRVEYGKFFDKLLADIGMDVLANEYERRAIISYYVQARLERTMCDIVKAMGFENLILAGGVFMNVKLNWVLSTVLNKISIMPLAGDQGAAIGLYQAIRKDLKWPNHLFWGHRILEFQSTPENFYVLEENDAKEFIIECIKKNQIVNLVKGSMEFGARALCHTSTLARSTNENVKYINMVNGRDTVMPMAPVVLEEDLENTFFNSQKIVKSLDYMICALEYKDTRYSAGASHYYPDLDCFTGRPQVAREQFIIDILREVPGRLLINTSMNEHGMPICYGVGDVVRCHVSQRQLDINNRIKTVVVR